MSKQENIVVPFGNQGALFDDDGLIRCFLLCFSAEEEVFCFFKIEVTAAENVNAIFGSLRGFGTLTFEEDGKCLEIAAWKNGGSSVEKSASRKEFSVIAAAAFFVGKSNEFT